MADNGKRGRGQPTKLTPELHEAICGLVREGVVAEVAAAKLGVCSKTFYNWEAWGREGRDPYAEFLQGVTQAKAEAEIEFLRCAREGDDRGVSNGPAKCAQWILERRWPKRYGAQIRIKVEEELGHFLEVAEGFLDRESYVRLLEAIAAEDRVGEAPQPRSDEERPVQH